MKKNFIYNVIYQILVLILPLITVPYVSRILGATGIGIYSYTYSIAYYFMIIAMLGLNNYGNRTIAKIRDDKDQLSKEFWSIYIFQLLLSIVMSISYFIYVYFINSEFKLIATIQILYVLSSAFDINWFFFGIEKFKLTITRNTIIKLSSLVLIFFFVKTNNDVWKYTLILSGSTLLSNIILFSFLKKYVRFTKISIADVLKHIKPNLILFLPVIATSIYNIMDKTMLGVLSSVTEVGYYENAEKIIKVPLAIITALGTVALPRVSNMLYNNKEKEVKDLISKTMPFVLFMAFPMTLGLITVAKDFSIIFFGEGFKKTGYLIQLLAIDIIFLSWGNVIRTQYLIPKGRDKEYIISAFLGAIINFIVNCIFIPIYYSVGACFGTIAAEFFVMFYQSWKVRKELTLFKYLKQSVGFFIKSVIMFIVINVIGNQFNYNLTRMIVEMFIGIALYTILNIKYISQNVNFKNLINKKMNV